MLTEPRLFAIRTLAFVSTLYVCSITSLPGRRSSVFELQPNKKKITTCAIVTDVTAIWILICIHLEQREVCAVIARATSVRPNFFWLPTNECRREMHFHSVRAQFPLATDSSGAQDRRRGPHNQR